MKSHFKIIITCHNVEKWIECSIRTLLGQVYQNWIAIIIDDHSTDKTYDILSELTKNSDNIILMQNKKQVPKIQNYFKAIDIVHPDNEDILVFLDGDDWLSDSEVLSYLASVYDENQVWITWGSFTEVKGKNPIVFGDYSKSPISKSTRPAPLSGNLRKGWRFSHLKTAKYFLWKNIKDESFRIKGTNKYYPAAIDCAFMWPMIEMAGPEHSKYITRLMYVYNNGNRQSYMYTIPNEQRTSYCEIRDSIPYSRKTKEELYDE